METEWKWEFKENIPKNNYLKTMGDVYSDYYQVSQDPISLEYDFASLKKYIYQNDIEKAVILFSTKEEFPSQYFIMDFLKFDWLELEQEVHLKNKIVYIFDVKD